MYSSQGVLAIVEKYDEDDNMAMQDPDEQKIVQTMQFFMRLFRRIGSFQHEHPVFGLFKFRKEDYQ